MKKVFMLIGMISAILQANVSAKIAVFCSADDKVNDVFKMVALTLGKRIGESGLGLITGGSCTGLMKEVVDGYVSSSLNVHHLYGVLPLILKQYNVHHQSIPQDQLIWVGTMHARLEKFHELSDIVIVLPGGFGTLHELMDFLVHNQFGLSKKMIILVNVGGYWDNLLVQFQVMCDQKLLAQSHFDNLLVASSEEECIQKIRAISVQQDHGLVSHYWEK